MIELETKALKALKRARVQLLIDYPFFGVLATHLELRSFRSPPHCAGLGVDGKYLHFDPEKVLELPELQLQGALAHECLHLALGHLWREENREHMKWNIATDYAVNPIVLSSLSKGGTRTLELPDGVYYDKDLEDTSAEEIYEKLPSPECPRCGSTKIKGVKYEFKPVGPDERKVRATFKCDSCGHEFTKEGVVREGSPGDFPFPFEESNRETPRTVDDHSMWQDAGDGGGSDGSEESAKELREKWKRRTVRAAQGAKSQGALPAGVDRLIEDLLYPQLNWRTLLSYYVTRQRGSNFDWRRPNRRWMQKGIYYPTKRENKLNAAVAIDTSGSVDDDELRDFLSELQGILNGFRSFEVRMFAADSDVHTEVTAENLRDFREFQTEIKGAGGTNYRPVFEKLKNSDTQVLVYLGDMRATFPEQAPPYDVIWVVSKDGRPEKPPFGKVVEMD